MASVPAPSAPARSRSGAAGSGLSARWHGIPVWLLAAGGGGGGFLLYRWWKNRSSSSSSTTAATPTTSANPASSDNSGTGTGYTGTGGGGAGGGEGAANNALLQQIEGQIASLTPASTTGPTTTPESPGTGTTTTGSTGATPSSRAVATVSQVAPGKILTGASVAPVGTPGTFDLPKGNVAFQPTAAVKNGNQVAYGIGNPTQAKAITSAGGTVETGKQLAAKGWKGVTPGASYLIR